MNCCCDYSIPLTVKSSAVTLTGGSLYITLPGIQLATLSNLQRLNVIICQSIPSGAGTAQVFLSDGTTKLPINVETGNYLHADQNRCRKCYPMIYGDNPAHASLLCRVCRTSFAASAAPAPAVAETVVASTKVAKS